MPVEPDILAGSKLCLRKLPDGDRCHELLQRSYLADAPGYRCGAGHWWTVTAQAIPESEVDRALRGEPEVCIAGHLLGAMGWTVAGVAACVTAIVAWWRRR